MAHTVIGTAGHIDHGKTLLVKALTGTDTDQAPEEKARGITIELGFAFLGEQTTIIDVPGHERFVKTMVAGVSTIDVAMLVIAADDGVMPQSREHLDVLQLLGVERGVVVLNKIDIAEPGWLELVEEEVREFTRGTFLDGAENFRVSALSGEGIDPLRQRLLELADATGEKRADAPFRLPVDRAFVVKGFGLVCTGTALAGTLRQGDRVEVMPEGHEVRVRTLQEHGAEVDQVRAGDRAAINLAGVDQRQIERGDMLVAPQYFRPTQMLDVRLRLLAASPMAIEPRTRVRLHMGTREIMARVVLPSRESLKPGQDSLAQLRLETPLVAAWGDRFVLRRYSPALTIGGGAVLDPHPAKHRHFEPEILMHLQALERGELQDVVENWIRGVDDRFKSQRELAGELGMAPERLATLVAELEAAGMVIRVEDQLLHRVVLERWANHIAAALRQFHAEEPLKLGLRRGELRNLCARYAQPELFDCALVHLESEGRVVMVGAVVKAADHDIHFTPEQEALKTEIEALVNTTVFADIPTAAGLARELAVERAQIEAILQSLQELGSLQSLEGGLLAHGEAIATVREKLCGYLAERGEITVAQFRELIGSNRKYAMALLGYFDAEGLTRRDGDVRMLLS